MEFIKPKQITRNFNKNTGKTTLSYYYGKYKAEYTAEINYKFDVDKKKDQIYYTNLIRLYKYKGKYGWTIGARNQNGKRAQKWINYIKENNIIKHTGNLILRYDGKTLEIKVDGKWFKLDDMENNIDLKWFYYVRDF